MYEKVNPIQQFNFQINRVLTYGEMACQKEDVRQRLKNVRNLEEWYKAWTDLSKDAINKGNYLHAAYYDRMAEFFLKHGDQRKELVFQKCLKEFETGYHQQNIRYEQCQIPFETGSMKCVRMRPSKTADTIVICGGYILLLRSLSYRYMSCIWPATILSYLKVPVRENVFGRTSISDMTLSRPRQPF